MANPGNSCFAAVWLDKMIINSSIIVGMGVFAMDKWFMHIPLSKNLLLVLQCNTILTMQEDLCVAEHVHQMLTWNG